MFLMSTVKTSFNQKPANYFSEKIFKSWKPFSLSPDELKEPIFFSWFKHPFESLCYKH